MKKALYFIAGMLIIVCGCEEEEPDTNLWECPKCEKVFEIKTEYSWEIDEPNREHLDDDGHYCPRCYDDLIKKD